jgi:uncharacterized RDD family membrane protein YckC
MRMSWYYSDGGKQVGPIDETELNRLVTLGAVRSDTLVWHEGLASWQPLGVVRGMHPAAAAAAGRRYAGFWIRFLARLIDGIIVGVINALVRIPLMLMFGIGTMGLGGMGRGLGRGEGGGLIFAPAMIGVLGISTLIGLVLGAAFEVYFLSNHGATPGKMALGLRVVRADGGPITPMLALGRHFAMWISAFILMIGYIMAAFDPEKRALHDRICDTRVIYSR